MAIKDQIDVEIHLKMKIRQENDLEEFEFHTNGQLFFEKRYTLFTIYRSN